MTWLGSSHDDLILKFRYIPHQIFEELSVRHLEYEMEECGVFPYSSEWGTLLTWSKHSPMAFHYHLYQSILRE